MNTHYAENVIPAGTSKAEFIEDILIHMSNIYSHVDIVRDNGGYALIRTYDNSNDMLDEYGVPDQQELYWTKTLKEMHDRLIETEGRSCRDRSFRDVLDF